MDPDGDELSILAGNYTPEIVDLALGYNYIDIHPLKEGTAYLVFGADDGKENGFVIYGVYVIIINNPDAVDGSPDGFPLNDINDVTMENIIVSPNPVVDNSFNLYYKLDNYNQVSLRIYDMTGRLNLVKEINNSEIGINNQEVNVHGLSPGVYILHYILNNNIIDTVNLLIK